MTSESDLRKCDVCGEYVKAPCETQTEYVDCPIMIKMAGWTKKHPRTETETFRYDLASLDEPHIILITDHIGKRSECPRLGYVVLPSNLWKNAAKSPARI